MKSNHSGDGGVIRVLLVDDDVPILEVSKRVLLMMGNFEIDHALSAEEAFKKLESRSYDIVVSDYEMPEKTGLDFLEEMRGGKNSSIPFVLFTGKGREEIAVKALNLGANAYISKQGNLETVYGELSHAIVDTVESKRAADAFADSDAKFRALIQNADDTIVLNDLHGKCIFRNQAYFRNLGFDEEGASEAEDFAKIHPDDLPIVRKKAQELSKNGSSTFEYRVKHRNGSWVYRYAKSTVIYNSCNQPYAILSIIRDVSEYKKAEELLKLSEQRYRELADCLPEIVFEVDSEANLAFANSKSYELTGYSKEDIAGGFNVLRLISSEEKDKASKNLQRVFSGKKGSPTEYTLIRKDGTSFPVLISTAPIVKEGKVVGGRGTIIDITERKKAEEEMQVASNLFRLARDAIFVHDMEGRIIYFNEATCKQTGYNEEEMSNMNLHALDAPESARLIQERMKELVKKGFAVFESVQLCKNGTRMPVEVHARLLESGDNELVLSVTRDITTRKQVEENLAASEEKYRRLFNEALDAIFLADAETGILVDCNQAALDLVGRERKEIIGHPQNILHPPRTDESELTDSFRQHLKQHEGQIIETEIITKKGKIRYVAIKANMLELKGKKLLQGIFRDITERKEAEQKLKEKQETIAASNQKLHVAGHLTRHDVRNKLLAMNGYSYILRKKYADKLDLVDGLTKIEQLIKDSDRIFEYSRMYEQLGAEKLFFVNVENALDEAVRLFSDPLPQISNKCQGLNLLADSFLRQLFYNFIDNTRKYGKKATIINVYFEKAEDNDFLRLIYEDDGVGIPVENKLKLFSRGFSTGGSTGFGLFLSKKMIDVYGWTIHENGKTNKGVRFTITIPRNNEKGQANYKIMEKLATLPFMMKNQMHELTQ